MSKVQMNPRPKIYEYLNYRLFLKDMYVFHKKESSKFSYRNFARAAGTRSSNFLKLIMDAKRNLGSEMVHRFAKALKLSREETLFFVTLVNFNQAKTAEEKNLHYEKILQTKSYHDVHPIEVQQYAYFSNWHFVALREIVNLKDFKEDAKWINQKLNVKLHSEEIKRAIHILIELQLLERDSSGRLKQTIQKITTTPELGSLAVINFHREMLRKASEALEKSRTAHRDISALTVAISKKQFERIRERLNQIRREIHAIASEDDHKDAVYQVNLQVFNLSEVVW